MARPKSSFLTLLSWLSFLPIATGQNPDSSSTAFESNAIGGERALWIDLVTRIEANYFGIDPSGNPVTWTEPQITDKVVELLTEHAAKSGKLISHPKNLNEIRDVGEVREKFFAFISEFRKRYGSRYPASQYVEIGTDMFCRSHLQFSQYWRQQFWQKRKEFEDDPNRNARPDFEVHQKPGDSLRCYPFTNSQAWERGIRNGDELIKYDGQPVEQMQLAEFASRFFGVTDSKVELTVRQTSGRTLTVTLTRSYFGRKVTAEQYQNSVVYKIPHLAKETADEIRAFLERSGESDVIIDMRGNGGGPYDAVANLVGLFAGGPRPLVVGKLHDRNDNFLRDLTTEEPRIETVKRLTVLVDEGTASTSELFLLALQEAEGGPNLVISGEKTYGKDVWIDASPIQGGGALIIPMGLMKTARGSTWLEGIQPTVQATP